MPWDSQDQSDLDSAMAAASDPGGWGSAPGPAGGGYGGGGWAGAPGPAGTGYGGFGGGMPGGSSGYGGPSTASAGPVGGAAVGGPAMGGPGLSTGAAQAAASAPAGPVSAGPTTGPAGPTYGGGISSAVSGAGPAYGGGLSAGSSGYGGPSTAMGGGYSGYSQSSAPQGPIGGGLVGGPAMGGYNSIGTSVGPGAGFGGLAGSSVGPGAGTGYGGLQGPIGGGMPVGSSGYGGPSTVGFAGNQMGIGGQFGPPASTLGIGPDVNRPSLGIGPPASIGIGLGQFNQGQLGGPYGTTLSSTGSEFGNPSQLVQDTRVQPGLSAPNFNTQPLASALATSPAVPGSIPSGLQWDQNTLPGLGPPAQPQGLLSAAAAPTGTPGWASGSANAFGDTPTALQAYGQPSLAASAFQNAGDLANASLMGTGMLDPSKATMQQAVQAADQLAGFPEGTMGRLVNYESARSWSPTASSGVGTSHALGLTQMQPGTAKSMGVTNPTDPMQQIFGGARYLGQQLPADVTQGVITNKELEPGLVQYYGGPGATMSFRGSYAGAPTGREYVHDVMASSPNAPEWAGGPASPLRDINFGGIPSPSTVRTTAPIAAAAATPRARQYEASQFAAGAGLSGAYPMARTVAPTSIAPATSSTTTFSPTGTAIPGQPVRDPMTGQPIDPMTGRPVPGANIPGVTTDQYGRPVTPQTVSPGRAMLSDIANPPATNIPSVSPETTARTTTPTSIAGLLGGTPMQPVAPTPGQQVDPMTGLPAPESLLGPAPNQPTGIPQVQSGLPEAPASMVPTNISRTLNQMPTGIPADLQPSPVPTGVPQPPVTQVSDFYRSALQSMLQPGVPAQQPVTPVEQRLQDVQNYGVFGDPAAAARRGLLPGTAVPEQVSPPELIAPNTLPSGYPPTAPSIPAARMAYDPAAAARRGLMPGAPAPAPGQPAPGAPQQLTQPPAQAPVPQPGLLPTSRPNAPMQTGLPPGLLGPLGLGGGHGGIPIVPPQMAAGGGSSTGSGRGGGASRASAAAKERGGGPSKGGRARTPSAADRSLAAAANMQIDTTQPLREGKTQIDKTLPLREGKRGDGGGGGFHAGMVNVPGLGWRMPGVYVGGRWVGPLSNFPQYAKSADAGGGDGNGGGGGGGGGKGGGGKEPFLTLGGSNKGQGKNPFITLMGDPSSPGWRNRNPILGGPGIPRRGPGPGRTTQIDKTLPLRPGRIAAIRSGRRKPTLAEVAAAAMPLGLIS